MQLFVLFICTQSALHVSGETEFHLVHDTGRQQHRWTISEAVNTVKCSWWWARTLPETCRAVWVQINETKFASCSSIRNYILKNFTSLCVRAHTHTHTYTHTYMIYLFVKDLFPDPNEWRAVFQFTVTKSLPISCVDHEQRHIQRHYQTILTKFSIQLEASQCRMSDPKLRNGTEHLAVVWCLQEPPLALGSRL